MPEASGSHAAAGTTTSSSSTGSSTGSSAGGETSTAELVTRLTQQSTELMRSELKLAQAEMTEKAKQAGIGAGLFGGAGVVALYGLGALIATLIIVLDLFLPLWLAALIITVVLFAIAGVVALLGKKKVSQATPAAPQKTIDNVKQDVATVKEARS